MQPKTEKEIDDLIDKTLMNHEANGKIWYEIKDILFSNTNDDKSESSS